MYQLRVTLQDIGPEVWRRVLVPGELTLRELHWVVQTVMGWTNSQTHVFSIGKKTFSDLEMEVKHARDEAKARLAKVAPKAGRSFEYEYDPRDHWTHTLEVESIVAEDQRYPGHPVCLAGECACPPENCGGVSGYYELLKALANPNHPGHKDAVLRVGEKFDPRMFYLEGVNRSLRQGWGRR